MQKWQLESVARRDELDRGQLYKPEGKPPNIGMFFERGRGEI
ncbi:hypothetical protein [Edaphobacter sp. HDX4]